MPSHTTTLKSTWLFTAPLRYRSDDRINSLIIVIIFYRELLLHWLEDSLSLAPYSLCVSISLFLSPDNFVVASHVFDFCVSLCLYAMLLWWRVGSIQKVLYGFRWHWVGCRFPFHFPFPRTPLRYRLRNLTRWLIIGRPGEGGLVTHDPTKARTPVKP